MSQPTDTADTPKGAAEALRSTGAIRARAKALLATARSGESAHFSVDDSAMRTAVDRVTEITRNRYPSLHIPYHSRWRHFEASGVDRIKQLDQRLQAADIACSARSRIDLAMVSVLLDAGAGPLWSYSEAGTGLRLMRSEGLGVASFHAFSAGLFSSDMSQPLQADASGLRAVTAEQLGAAFQVSAQNPLVGLEARAALLQRLGESLAQQSQVFGTPARPGGLFDHLPRTADGAIETHEILEVLLRTLSGIWPAQNSVAGIPLGDCWRHPGAPGPGLTQGWMPFHKLSQWLTYSLLEPLEWAGVPVRGLDALTGLPEYRNGGLFLDTGVLRPTMKDFNRHAWQVGDAFIVEWRALTVALLDELAPMVRGALGRSAEEMPLACVLEGGTWAAGRSLAQSLRSGLPPLMIESDGTVF